MMLQLISTGYIFPFLLVFCYSFNLIQAQIPRVCVQNVTLSTHVCCPLSPINGLTCGGDSRGSCESVVVFQEPVNAIFNLDDRRDWPIHFFHRLCQCRGNYFGVSCEECKFGWTGENCDEKVIYTRRNIKTFTKEEKTFFRHLVARSDEITSDYMLIYENDVWHSDPLFQPRFIPTTIHKFIVAMHRYASRATLFKDPKVCKEDGILDYNHGVTMFALWHRYFMLVWEKELRKIAKKEFGVNNFAIPYWDWIDAKECEVCTNDLVGAAGKYMKDKDIQVLSSKSIFYKWIEYCQPPERARSKCFGCHFRKEYQPLNRLWTAYEYPTSKELEFVMAKKEFYVANEGSKCQSFHKAMEGFCGNETNNKYLWMHNRVHNMVSGSFCCAATAANDPLFILHHSQIDRILQVWFNLYKPSAETALPMKGMRPGQYRDSNIVGFLPLLKNKDVFVDIKELGFTYDDFSFGKHGVTFRPV